MSDQTGKRLAACLSSALLMGALLGSSELAAQVTVLPESPSEPEGGAEKHAVVEGETLSLLAERYLGDPEAWPRLWSFNPEITNPHWIYPGLVLRLRQGVDLGSPAVGAPVLSSHGVATRGRFGLGPRRYTAGAATVLIGEELYLDRDALAQAARIVGSSEDHLMLSPTDEVFLQFKERAAEPAPGKELTVFVRLHRSEIAAKAGKVRTYYAHQAGEVVRVLGGLRIVSYDREKRIARAVVTDALGAIERGFEVADVPRRLKAVAAKPNARDVKAKVVAATRALGTLGDGQLVFLDAGAKQGVEVGNRFFVLREGDPWREQLPVGEDLIGAQRPDKDPLPSSALPRTVVGELRVLYVRPGTATALITTSLVELSPGDRVEMQAGH